VVASTRKRIARASIFPIAVVLIVGIALTVLAFVVLRNRELSDIVAMFERDARDRVSAIERMTDKSAEILEHLRALRESSESVSRDEFETFAVDLLREVSGIQALEWIPLVPNAERVAYEQAVLADGLVDFRITERSPEGEMVVAKVRDEYFPVYYVVPMEGNEVAVGFDLGSNEARLDALNLARDTGECVATEPILLVQEPGQRQGFLLFLPIYASGSKASIPDDRRDGLEGFFLGVFRVGDLIESALATMTPAGIHFNVVDVSPLEEKQLIYRHESRPSSPGEESTGANGSELVFAGQIDVGGRVWAIECLSIAGYVPAKRQPTTWWVLVSGLLLAVLLSVYLASTARQRAREVARLSDAMHISEERFRTLVENANDGIYIRDADGTIVYANEKFAGIHGYPLEEIVGRQAANLLSTEFGREASKQEVREALQLGRAIRAEAICSRPDGERRDIEISAAAICLAPGVNGVFGIVRDITERKEQARRKAQFMADVAHGVRTPLTSIKGYADLLLMKKDGISPSENEKYLAVISSNADRLARLVGELLDSERLESGLVALDLQSIRLDEILRDEIVSIEEVAKAKGLKIDTTIEDGLWVEADADRLAQLLSDLLSNAVKYTEQGSISVEAQRREKEIAVSIHDTGVGIASEELGKVFTRFFRSRAGANRQVEGTGLGLFIARTIAERHGGWIDVESIQGSGSTFTLTLPAKPTRSVES
jgi:PAS domain S-box-containing protein